MGSPTPRPDTINRLRFGADSAIAMLAGMQLDLFTALRNGLLTAEQLADALGVDPARLSLLLYALVAAELLTERDGYFSNTPEAQHYLVKGAPSYMSDMLLFLGDQWSRNLKTAESLRTGNPQARWDFSGDPPEKNEARLRRINIRSAKTAYELLERYDFSSTTSLVDVGGGGGAMAITMVKACPQLRATIFDLPQVIPITRKIVVEEGVADRVTIIASDVVNNPVPGAYDVGILSRLLHVLSKEDAQSVVQNVSGAILPGGSIYLIDMILDDSRLSPPEAIGFNLSAINFLEAGAAYTESEGVSWLRAAGFVDIQRSKQSMQDGHGLMTARKGK